MDRTRRATVHGPDLVRLMSKIVWPGPVESKQIQKNLKNPFKFF
jgi:hypothetical protein